MTVQNDRWSGVFFILVGLLLNFVIIPGQTEQVGYGWTQPDTLPKAMAVAIMFGGFLTVLKPVDTGVMQPRTMLRTVMFATIIAAGIVITNRFGFVMTAPFIALAVMLAAYERRLVWLISACLLVPAALWVTVMILLERPLP